MINKKLIIELEDKDEKNEVEWSLLQYYYTISIISDILVEESKLHISCEEAIKKIRDTMDSNL